MKKKKALITGITGQDGSYLAEFLLKKNYTVVGMNRRTSSFNTSRIDHLISDPPSKKNNSLYLIYGDMTDSLSLMRAIKQSDPDEIYNLAAQSHVGVSFEEPEYTANTIALGTLRILEIIKNYNKKIKFYNASTSEIFGNSGFLIQDENTPFHPRSPYGAAKLYAHWITVNYRDAYNLHASNGILFNHESERRGQTFVTSKIINALVKIKFKKQEKLYLGNIYSKRDWGHAKDYVEMQWLMLQQKEPSDYVIATGKSMTIKNFVNLVSKKLDMKLVWSGKGINEKAKWKNKVIIEIDKRYFRPTEVDSLNGDASKAQKKLKWIPKISINEIIDELIKSSKSKIKI
jgi:GDPmannose 4,6-dehydratase